jgi:hypothetical protein
MAGARASQQGRKKKVDFLAKFSVMRIVISSRIKQTDVSPQFKRYPQTPSVEATIASPLGCHYYFPHGANEQAYLSSDESRYHLLHGEHPQFPNYLARQYSNVMSYFQAVMPGFGSCASALDPQQAHEHSIPSNQDVS